jgi:hypothetical protein
LADRAADRLYAIISVRHRAAYLNTIFSLITIYTW